MHLIKAGAVNLKSGKTKLKELDSSSGAIKSEALSWQIQSSEKLYKTGILYLDF